MVSSRVMVTGAAGLLGASLVVEALQAGRDVVPVYRERALKVPGLRLDLLNTDAMLRAVQQLRPAWIIHCAAVTNVDWAQDHPEATAQVNGWLPGELAAAAASVGARVLYVSTDSVFDGSRGAYRETDTPAPMNVYATTKLQGEDAIRAAHGRHVVLRTNIHGWNALDKQSLSEWMLGRLESGSPFPAFGDVVFSPLLVNDLATVMIELIDRDIDPATYHAGAADAVSKFDFAVMLADLSGTDRLLVQRASAASAGFRAPRPRNTSLISEKLERALEQRLPTVKDGLVRFLALRDRGFPADLHTLVEN